MSIDVVKKFNMDSIHIIEAQLPGRINRGTGFCVSGDLLLTAFHVVEDANDIKVFLSSDAYANGDSLDAECIYHSEKLDVAILKVSSQATMIPIQLFCTTVNLDTELMSCGYPIEKGHCHAPITVEVTNTFDHMISADWSFEVSQSHTVSKYKGMSGSPVMREGMCVGILLVQQANNTLYAVSTKDFLGDMSIREVIEANGVTTIVQQGIEYQAPPHPKSPFEYSINCANGTPRIKGIDIGFTFNQWNLSKFIEGAYDWLIDYSLSHKDKATFEGSERSLFKFARQKFPQDELAVLGDLCLHIAIRESYSTIPVMNRVFDMQNKTFSCTHAVLNFESIELWIGASAVCNTIDEAIATITDTVNYIASLQSLKNRLIALTSEIDPSWPHKEKLEKLADSSLPIDERFDRVVIPVFIMHDSDLITDYDKTNFLGIFQMKIDECRALLNSADIQKGLVDLIDFKVFYFPVSSIDELHSSLIKELNS